MSEMRRLTAILLLALVACAETRTAPHKELAGVSLTFDHFGGSVNPLDQHMLENGVQVASEKPGHDSWLRLTNNSTEVISFRTYSMYSKQPIRWYVLPDKSRIIALEDGMQIALPFGVESRRGNEIELRSAIDMFWGSFLPPGRSVLFSVPAPLLKRQHKVYVSYGHATATIEDYRVYYQAPR